MGDSSIFEEDEVCLPVASGGFKYGLVIESHEYASSDDEDEHTSDHVRKGHVKVSWHPKGEESITEEKQLILADRSLMPGDVIRRLISGEESQRGFIQDLEVKCHVKIIGTDLFIYNVDAKDIDPIQEYDPEPFVTLDSWIGQVMEVNEEITVKFPDGARCILENAQNLGLYDVNDRRKQYSEFFMRNFYVGQTLSGSSWVDFEDAVWLHSTRLRGPGKYSDHLYAVPIVVEQVRTKGVDIHWICKGFTKTKNESDKLKAPPSWIMGENLTRMKRMECFDYCHRQVGDKCLYTIKKTDALLRNMSPRQHATPDVIELMSKDNAVVLGTSADGIIVVHSGSDKGASKHSGSDRDGKKQKVEKSNKGADKKSVVQKAENDGACADDEFEDIDDSEEEGAGSDTSGSFASDHLQQMPMPRRRRKGGIQTRRMKKLNVNRANKKLKSSSKEVKPGDTVPIEIWYTFSVTSIMWQDGSVEVNIPSPELFPIHHLDELEFFPGDFVVDSKGDDKTGYGVVESCDHKERTVIVRWMKPYTPGKTQSPEEIRREELSVYDIKDHPDYKFRPGHTVIRVGGYENTDQEMEAVGQVFSIEPHGAIDVWWPSSAVTRCYPQDLYIVSEMLSEDGSADEWTDDDDDESVSDMSWETEGEETDSDAELEDIVERKPGYLSEEKRKDLDELLLRVRGAVKGLTDVFLNTSGSFFKNSKQVFEDVLIIFKRCKEMEKILKSSYFDDDQIANLISEVKQHLRLEKTSELAKHVYEVFKFRINPLDGQEEQHSDVSQGCDNTGVPNSNCNGNAMQGAETNEATDGMQLYCTNSVEGDVKNVTDDQMSGADGGSRSDGRHLDMSRIKQALATYGENIEDRVWQDIFQEISGSSVDKSKSEIVHATSEGYDDVAQNSDQQQCVSRATDLGSETMRNGCDSFNPAVVDTSLPEEIFNISSSDTNTSQVGNGTTDGSTATAVMNPVDGSTPNSSTCTVMLSEGEIHGELVDEPEDSEKKTERVIDVGEVDEVKRLPASHRNLCLHVCKAISSRLMMIQDELNRRGLELELKCEEKDVFDEIKKRLAQSMGDDAQASVETGDGVTGSVKEMGDLAGMEASLDTAELSVTEGASKPEDLAVCQGTEQETAMEDEAEKRFELLPETPTPHWYFDEEKLPLNIKVFNTAVRKELLLLRTSLPDGILVKAFEDRMDLFSVLIYGPAHTPYEDGLFVFDVHLPDTYPTAPPWFQYHSFCNERLNPNLYEDGKVCVSLLGTWSGKGSEVWTKKSNLLQVLVSIQGLILVAEPYFNEAGYERQRGTQHGQENSRMYNEMAILKLVQSMTKMAVSPPTMFVKETRSHLQQSGLSMIRRIEHWLDRSSKAKKGQDAETEASSQSESRCVLCNQSGDHDASCKDYIPNPDFSLLPVSKGFCITMRKHLDIFKGVLTEHILTEKQVD